MSSTRHTCRRQCRRALTAALALMLAASLVAAAPSPAAATFPGDNGPLLTPGGMLREDGTYQLRFGFDFYPAYGAFSAEGDQIAYQKMITSDQQTIRVRTADGTDTEVLKLPVDYSVEKISWSPDATRLAVGVREFTGNTFINHVLLVSIADAQSTKLVAGTGNWDPEYPEWRPEGNEVAFIRGNDLFTVDAVTGAEVQRTFECTYDTTPGEGATCDFDPVETQVSYPTWAPDGESVVVDVRDSGFDTGEGDSYVGTIAFGSSTVTKLLDLPEVNDGSYSFSRPQYSPDGTKLVLTYRINLDDQTSYVADLGQGGPPVSMNDDFWISDWQPCPGGVCPSFGSDKATPTLAVTALKDDFGVNVFARLTPAHTGTPLTVTLARKTSSGWKNVRTLSIAQNKQGLVVASFDRVRAPRCRFTATFAGDADHLAVTTRRSFAC